MAGLAFAGEGPKDTAPYTDALLDPLRLVGDPLADAALRELDAPRAGALLRAVEARAETGAACRALLDHVHALPSWVDFRRMGPAHRRSFEHAVVGGLSLLGASLVESFCAARGAKVLVRSGRLRTMPQRRVYETARFTFDIAASGGAPPGSSAHRDVVEVRLLHALVRRQLLAHGRWDTLAWGHPVNQEDYASTLLMFSHVYVRGLSLLGVHLDAHELDGVHHTWRWVGHVMGVDPSVLPTSVDEERTLYAAVTRRQFHPDEDSRVLTHGLLDALAGKPPFYLSRHALHALSRRLVGDGLADALHLSRPRRWSRGMAGLARMAEVRERLEHRLPLGRQTARAVGRAISDGIIRRALRESDGARSWARDARQ